MLGSTPDKRVCEAFRLLSMLDGPNRASEKLVPMARRRLFDKSKDEMAIDQESSIERSEKSLLAMLSFKPPKPLGTTSASPERSNLPDRRLPATEKENEEAFKTSEARDDKNELGIVPKRLLSDRSNNASS